MTPDFPPPKSGPQPGQRIMAVFVSVPKCAGRVVEVRRGGYRWTEGPDDRLAAELGNPPVDSFTVELNHERLGKRTWDLPAEQFRGPWTGAPLDTLPNFGCHTIPVVEGGKI